MKKKVLFICGARGDYTRNEVVVQSLKENYDVIEISSNGKSYMFRLPNVVIRYLLNFKKYDILFVGFYGQLLVPIVRLFSRKPIIFDAFISTYDTLCFDRKKFKPNSIIGRITYYIDKLSCSLADKIILDTNAHIDYFIDTFGLSKNKFQRIFVGANEEIFYPRQIENDSDKFIVFYYGTFLPLQGIEYLVRAAKLLENEDDIKFIVVGSGMETDKIIRLSNELQNKNIEFIDWIPYQELPLKIAEADVCLGGHFSNVDKAKRVIAGKTFQFIAMKKPVIVGDNPANWEIFEHGIDAFFVEMASAEALADAILVLKKDDELRTEMAINANNTFREVCKGMSYDLNNIIEDII
ncbi:glycosyltransferase family 4 protein [Methanolobus sp. WCC4]|uniref:glycosyltransferase family 4 protein n=1 Tax=Methanolobus sp. WCC4 TaxID=3125784 RepID=UPI0030F89C90